MKDFLGKEVKEGDKVIVLVKSYGYQKISDAYLTKQTFLGEDQWGYKFGNSKRFFRIRKPQMVKI